MGSAARVSVTRLGVQPSCSVRRSGRASMQRRSQETLAAWAGWCAGVGLFFALNHFVPEAHCRDGTTSQSIGVRGACSHHGGVKRYTHLTFLALVFSAGVGWTVYVRVLPKPIPGTQPSTPTPDEIIRRAISNGHRISFLYRAKGEREFTERAINPEAITTEGYPPGLCVSGFCEERRALRTFKLLRMSGVRELDS